MSPRVSRSILTLTFLLSACGTPSDAPAPPPPPEPTPEAASEPTPEPTPMPGLAFEDATGDLCRATGFDRLTDGRVVVTDAGVADSVTVYSAEGIAKGTPTTSKLGFMSNEGPLPERIEDLSAVASRGDKVVLVGSFAHAEEDGCPIPEHRAKILVGEASLGELEWRNRLRMKPCAWNGTGPHCPDGVLPVLDSVDTCKEALFTSKITTSGDSVCETLVKAEAEIKAGTCGPGFAVAAATIVTGRAGNKLWIALRSPLSVAGETILLRLEQPLEALSTLSFDRASYIGLPKGYEIRGLATEGNTILGVADGPEGAIQFSFSTRDLRDGEAVTATRTDLELPNGVQSISSGLSGPVALWGGEAGADGCTTKPRVAVLTTP